MTRTDTIFDRILAIASKSCPEKVASQGHLELWQANRDYVVAGLKFVKMLAREVATSPNDYRDMASTILAIYHGLLNSEQAICDNLLQEQAEWDNLADVGVTALTGMQLNIDALMAFDPIEQAHQEARKQPPRWRQD